MSKKLTALLCIFTLILTTFSVSAYTAEDLDVINYTDDFSHLKEEETTILSSNITGVSATEGEVKTLAWKDGAEWQSSPKWIGESTGTFFFKEYSNKALYRLCMKETKNKGVTMNLSTETPYVSNYTNIKFTNMYSYTQTSGLRFAVSEDEETYIEFGMSGTSASDAYGKYPQSPYITKSVNGVRTLIGSAPESWGTYKGGTDINWCTNEWDIDVCGDNITLNIKLHQNGSSTPVIYNWSFGCSDPEISSIVSGSKFPIALFGKGNNEFQFERAEYTTGGAYVSTMGEPSYALYIPISKHAFDSENNVYKFAYSAPVRRIKADSSVSMTIELSEDNVSYDTYNVTTNSEGMWLNDIDDKKYTYVRLPEGVEADSVEILTETSGTSTINVMQFDTVNLYPLIDGSFTQDVTWNLGDETLVSVIDGAVSGIKDGETNIKCIASNGVELNGKIKIIGELTNAIETNTVAEYLASKAPIIANLNSIIENDDTEALSEFLLEDGENNLSKIHAIDRTLIINLQAEDADTYARYLDKIVTLDEFKLEILDDLYAMQDTLDNVKKLCYIDNLSDKDLLFEKLGEYNDYFALDLENKYFLSEKANVLQAMLNKVYKNKKELATTFNEQYVILNLKASDTYKYVGEIITNCKNEIGFNVTKFNKLTKPSKLYECVLAKKAEIDTLEELCDYIDSYKESTGGSGGGGGMGGSGGGGGSSGGSGGSGGLSHMFDLPETETVKPEPIVDEGAPIPVVEQISIFSDVPVEHWAYEPVRYLIGIGAVNKNSEDGTFRANSPVTRAEFVKMVVIGMNLKTPEEITAETEQLEQSAFNDVNTNDWYYSYVNSAYSLGIVSGNGNGNFNPNGNITREEMSAILMRCIENKGYNLEYTAVPVDFNDRETISDWALSAVIKLQLTGVVNGDENSCFRPKDTATRAEVAKVIYKSFYSNSAEEEVQDEEA